VSTKYTVTYEQDESGWWVATVRGVPGVHTQGRSIETAKRRIAEALTAALGEGHGFELVHDFRVRPKAVKAQLAAIAKARAMTEREQAKAASLMRKLAKELAQHMSVRDAGEVLGVSGQRVQQLIQGDPRMEGS
jgi:predicted RNase H-like HicB family nuclease